MHTFYTPFTSFYKQKQALPACAATFAPFVHPSYKHMNIRMFLVLFFLQAILACVQAPEATTAVACIQTPRPPAEGIVFQSVDGGQTWQDISAGLSGEMPANALLTDASGAMLLSSGDGIYRHVPPPATQNWEKTELPAEEATSVFAGRNGLFAGRYERNFFQNIPGTDIWLPWHENLADKTVRAMLETPDGSVIVGCESGLFKTTDSGKTWKRVFEDNTVLRLYATEGALLGVCFRGLLRSTDGGESWEWSRTFQGDFQLETRLDGRLVAVVRHDGHWELAPFDTTAGVGNRDGLLQGLQAFRFLNDLVQVGNQFFCSHKDGISRSVDGGQTWELVFPATDENLPLRVMVTGEGIFVVKTVGC